MQLPDIIRGLRQMLALSRYGPASKEYEQGLKYLEEKRYVDAEEVFRRVLLQQQHGLGEEHIQTLWSKYHLGIALYHQKSYTEAEEVLQQLVMQRERSLGTYNLRMVDCRYWLGMTCYKLGDYTQAEMMLRKSINQQKKVLGFRAKGTLEAEYQLAVTLYAQEKYIEAEEILRQSVQQRTRYLGAGHKNTLKSEKLLQQTTLAIGSSIQRTPSPSSFHAAASFNPPAAADLTSDLQRTADFDISPNPTPTPGSASASGLVVTSSSADPLDPGSIPSSTTNSNPAATPSSATTAGPIDDNLNTLVGTLMSRLGEFFIEGSQRQTAYTDLEIQRVSQLLSEVHQQWSKTPRTYIILRTIDYLDVLNTFIDLGFSDHWLPLSERGFPSCMPLNKRLEFMAVQNLVMTKSMDLENGRHCYFREYEPLPLEIKEPLGSGGSGRVDRALSLISFKEYALKRVSRSAAFRGRKAETVKQFIAEIEVLKRLQHRHVVHFVGSYTDTKYLGLIVSPIADMDLCTYLTQVDTAQQKQLRNFFGCLASALSFLHEQKVRHKDIKPRNILVHGRNVLFTDFGLAFDFVDEDRSTTIGMTNGLTPKYCAPEVADHEPRNTSSDIWSLGVVFLEMTMVLKGKTVDFMYKFLQANGSHQDCVRTNADATNALIQELKNIGHPGDNEALKWVQDMTLAMHRVRPTAAQLRARIMELSHGRCGGESFCGTCCSSFDDGLSDFDDLEIDDTR